MAEKKEQNIVYKEEKMKKIILVTGASRGIGRDISITLAKENIVIANYNKSENEAKELEKISSNIEIYKADVSDSKQVKKMVEYIIKKYGKIDVLINNAGIFKFNLIQNIEENEWDEIINTNLKSVFLCSKEVVKQCMLNRKDGCIINISSVDGTSGASCEVHYAASKAGIDGITKALAKELGPSNIRVNSIAPGAIDTEMNKEVSTEDWEVVIEETPLRKIGKPQDITKCVKWLIEDEFTTGQVISINGGWRI